MASIFQRIFKVAQSEAHASMDKFEDPIKMSEQGVRGPQEESANVDGQPGAGQIAGDSPPEGD